MIATFCDSYIQCSHDKSTYLPTQVDICATLLQHFLLTAVNLSRPVTDFTLTVNYYIDLHLAVFVINLL